MATNHVDRLMYAWRLLQQRVNTDIPSRVSQLRSARYRISRIVPPPPPGL